MRFVACIVRECQLRLCGHVARFPDADPAHQILSARESREWRRQMGRPRASWLQQVDQHQKEMGMGQASTWWMARRRPLEYWWKVDAVTRCSGACSHIRPDLMGETAELFLKRKVMSKTTPYLLTIRVQSLQCKSEHSLPPLCLLLFLLFFLLGGYWTP